ncbi:MAG TPA: molybdate ABC transporter substrate-binding protein [Polymorphobacter sp.]|jgi:molybdate transport system substrate-binding protein|nr:molybdate ABC transporter substrate-binding protein [Polymorphobacter sp.]
MIVRSKRRLLLALGVSAGLLAVLAAPLAAQPSARKSARGPLVLAAASLQESLTAAADAWAAQGNPRPVLSFAASSVLARQIDAGAPADMFISADEQWMDFLEGKKRIVPGTRTGFLTNTLVLVAPSARPFKLAMTPGFALAAALGSGRLAMADPDSVPAGKYGKAALTNLGVWRDVESKVVRAENVRAALLLVARDEAAAGIVYATDARAATDVVVVGRFPATSHAPITYPLALLASSRHRDTARFRSFLLSPAGKAIFARYGFGTGPVR